MKKLFCAVLALMLLASAVCTGCGKPKEARIVHCDNCGKGFEVDADSNLTDEWILYCTDCEKELGLDNIIPDIE